MGRAATFLLGAFDLRSAGTPVIPQKDANDPRRGEVSPERLPGHHLE
jgi:hypothetical protein